MKLYATITGHHQGGTVQKGQGSNTEINILLNMDKGNQYFVMFHEGGLIVQRYADGAIVYDDTKGEKQKGDFGTCVNCGKPIDKNGRCGYTGDD